MVSAFLLIYYTDVAGISATAAGRLFLVVRVWGGVTDLLAGRRVDRTDTRWGRFRPYLLFGSVPLLLLLVAMFSIPGGLDDSGKVVWAYVTYALFSLAYSFVNIPYGWCFAVSRERVARDPAVISVRQTVSMVRHNRPLLLPCASSALFLSGMFSLQTVGVYYARDVLGNADLYIVLILVQTVGMILASVAMPRAVEAVGKKRTYLMAGAFAALSAGAVAVAPARPRRSASPASGCSGSGWA
jgi:Na+/melibiose symporter-like transporter